MLHNDHRTIAGPGGAKLVIAGVPDPALRRFGAKGPDFGKALENAPRDAVRIMLAHQPDGESGNDGIDLKLSGHTHGGMLFFLKTLLAHFNGGLVHGLYEVKGMQIYVSPGTGVWAGFSCRLGVPSEITRIVLRAEDR
jgi:predicted MPP superfamily phosphohydrolase